MAALVLAARWALADEDHTWRRPVSSMRKKSMCYLSPRYFEFLLQPAKPNSLTSPRPPPQIPFLSYLRNWLISFHQLLRQTPGVLTNARRTNSAFRMAPGLSPSRRTHSGLCPVPMQQRQPPNLFSFLPATCPSQLFPSAARSGFLKHLSAPLQLCSGVPSDGPDSEEEPRPSRG